MAIECKFKIRLKSVLEFCLLYLSTVITTASSTCISQQYESVNNKCLFLETNSITNWYDAMQTCRSKSGSLAIIEDTAYFNQIREIYFKKVGLLQ